SGGARECYMPWNGAGAAVTALLADKEGAFIATDKGVQRIVLGQPTETDGYGGYVRVPLGDDYAYPRSDREQQLLAGIDEWQGVPYRWGGQTKAGADCSGFVGAVHRSLGVNLPRTSKQMGETRMGARVRDELRYGDTLVYPGHVALYIGNGRTGETVGGSSTSTNGSVSKSTIWRRRNVIVKRFLP
ncbi:MAG: C40 family peptidase, partial [Akkermansiaceae bacterium]|nr:C40 family peptidase [Armatimonadota bacterium]